jgi:hypothetical protein
LAAQCGIAACSGYVAFHARHRCHRSNVFCIQGERLILTDPAALNHVLTSHTYDYAKPEEVRGDLAMVLGKDLVFAEGAFPQLLRAHQS